MHPSFHKTILFQMRTFSECLYIQVSAAALIEIVVGESSIPNISAPFILSYMHLGSSAIMVRTWWLPRVLCKMTHKIFIVIFYIWNNGRALTDLPATLRNKILLNTCNQSLHFVCYHSFRRRNHHTEFDVHIFFL